MSTLAATIETLEHRWMRAWMANDAATLKALTARNFRLVVGSQPPMMLDRKSWLESVGREFSCASYRFGGIYVRDLGGMTVFASLLDLDSTMAREEYSGKLWVTDLWRKGKVRRRWQLVERILSRPEELPAIPRAVRALQLWR